MLLCRIIPAHAGSSRTSARRAKRPTDHPRACGEQHHLGPHRRNPVGSSPRMRGAATAHARLHGRPRIIPAHAGSSQSPARWPRTPQDHPRACGEQVEPDTYDEDQEGSSPRMRGAVAPLGATEAVLRIIPAHAGSRSSLPLAASVTGDHPRACGEQTKKRAVKQLSSLFLLLSFNQFHK